MKIEQSLYRRAARCEPTERFPIWMMRQAGRYMKAYQEIRTKLSLIEMFRTPSVAAEVTLQPVDAFGMDAAILFSDILVVPDSLGLGLNFIEQQGPVFANPIRSQSDVDKLDPSQVVNGVSYVLEAIKLVKNELNGTAVPLIGFAGAPFTVASYMIGQGKKHSPEEFMKAYFSNTELIHRLLDVLTTSTIHYLNAQLKAGVDAIQIFDSWSSVLSWPLFQELALPYLKKLIAGLNNIYHVPITVFGLSHTTFYPLLQDIGADVIGFDSRANMRSLRHSVKPSIAVQGNLDPHLLLASGDVVEKQVLHLLDSMKDAKGFIFNLGHGVLPEVKEERVAEVVALVKAFSTSH